MTSPNAIHPTAVIGKSVKMGANVLVKPYCVIEGDIEIGDNCQVGPFAHITGTVKIGKGTKIHSCAAIGEPPQDYSWDQSPGLIEIGEGCMIREGVTIHTPVHGNEGGKTIVGNNVFLMTNSHLGHNAIVGNGAVLASGCVLGGYAEVGEFSFLSGNAAMHQLCRIGAYCMCGGITKITRDVPPYCMVDGHPAKVHGLNVVGLRRRGFTPEQREQIKDAYKMLYDLGSGVLKDRLAAIEAKYAGNDIIMKFTGFVKSSKRGLTGQGGNED